jgi:hypothetical protein
MRRIDAGQGFQGATRISVLWVSAALLAGAPAPARADSANAIAGGVTSAAVATILCAALASLPNPTAEEEPFARRGWLLGAAGTFAVPTAVDARESDLQNLDPTASLSVDDGFGMSGWGGFRCHRFAAAALEVEWIDSFDSATSAVVQGVPVGTIDTQTVTVTSNLKGYYWTGRYQPFLQFGAGVMTASGDSPVMAASIDDADFALRMGGGIDVFATENVVLNLGFDYVLPLGDVENLDYLSIGWGLEYRF